MAGEVDYLILAYRLSVLTFYLGALIYALPIPYQGLKRWAPRLLADGIGALVIVLVFEALFQLANTLAAMAGGSWELLESWAMGGIAEFLTIKAVAALLNVLPDPLGVLRGAQVVVKPLDRLATTALFFIAFIVGLAEIVKVYGRLLAAIGVALYAAPFRVARSAGAWLLSFILVFTAGLQALPVFATAIGGTPQPIGIGPIAEKGLALLKGNVSTMEGPADGVILVTDADTGEVYAVYLAENGTIMNDHGSTIVTIPSKPNLAYKLVYLNVTFYLEPYPVNKTDYKIVEGAWSIDLKTSYALTARNGIAVYTNGEILSASRNGGTVEGVIHLQQGQYVSVRYVDGCTIDIDPGGLQEVGESEWQWGDLHGQAIKYEAPDAGDYHFQVTADCPQLHISYDTKDYVNIAKKIAAYYDINVIQAFIAYWFTIPTIYIAILTSASLGVARLLGGRERFPLRVF
ncbi:MAG: hypothetical protein F7C35_04340 [Desulfurococcales archaeon]|nr:hypothetical protein [Desulfurococcales archaeon]